jgi:hypothetical protein
VTGWWVSMDDGRATVWWGPFDDAALCQRFCAFVTREIDPAVMLGPPTEPRSDRVVLNPLHEVLAFYEQQAREASIRQRELELATDRLATGEWDGNDLMHAIDRAAEYGETTWLIRDGRRIAAIRPRGSEGIA